MEADTRLSPTEADVLRPCTGLRSASSSTSLSSSWLVCPSDDAALAVLLQAAFRVEPWRRPAVAAEAAPAATPIGMALLGVRVDPPAAGVPAASVRSGYLLPFEIVSVHLLVVLVGAAYLARAKRRRTPRAIEVAASMQPPGEPPRPGRGSVSALAAGGSR